MGAGVNKVGVSSKLHDGVECVVLFEAYYSVLHVE
jgi:hypothetical protein